MEALGADSVAKLRYFWIIENAQADSNVFQLQPTNGFEQRSLAAATHSEKTMGTRTLRIERSEKTLRLDTNPRVEAVNADADTAARLPGRAAVSFRARAAWFQEKCCCPR